MNDSADESASGGIAPIVGGIAPARHDAGAGRRKAGRVLLEAMPPGF